MYLGPPGLAGEAKLSRLNSATDLGKFNNGCPLSAPVRSVLSLPRVFTPCGLLRSSAETRPRKLSGLGWLLARGPPACSRESQHPNADGLRSPAEDLILTWPGHDLLGPSLSPILSQSSRVTLPCSFLHKSELQKF